MHQPIGNGTTEDLRKGLRVLPGSETPTGCGEEVADAEALSSMNESLERRSSSVSADSSERSEIDCRSTCSRKQRKSTRKGVAKAAESVTAASPVEPPHRPKKSRSSLTFLMRLSKNNFRY
jgi:hypothetical protein